MLPKNLKSSVPEKLPCMAQNCGKFISIHERNFATCQRCSFIFCTKQCKKKNIKKHRTICKNVRKTMTPFFAKKHKLVIEDLRKEYKPSINRNIWHDHLDRGDGYNRIGEYEKAIKDFSIHIRYGGDEVGSAYFKRGFCYMSIGEKKKAIDDFTEYIDNYEPETAAPYLNRGQLYRNIGEHKKSLADSNSAIRMEPRNWDSWVHRGKAYSLLGEPEKAIADFTRALELTNKKHPLYVLRLCDRGDEYMIQEKYEKAKRDFLEAIRIKPNSLISYYNHAICCIRLGEMADGMDSVQMIFRISGKRSKIRYSPDWRENTSSLADLVSKLVAEARKVVDEQEREEQKKTGEHGLKVIGREMDVWRSKFLKNEGEKEMHYEQCLDVKKRCRFCEFCGKNKRRMKKCGRCRSKFYCSVDCQKKDWKVHKLTCKKNDLKRI